MSTRATELNYSPTFIFLSALLVRLGWLELIPSESFSYDMSSWMRVSEVLAGRGNPYQALPVLNWGPVWAWCLLALGNVSAMLEISLASAVRGLLITSDLLILMALIKLGATHPTAPSDSDGARVTTNAAIFWLYAVHPLPILLSVQHLNFDAIMLLLTLFSILKLRAFLANEDPVDWLYSAGALGLAIATKTVAGIFLPLLAAGSRSLPPKTLFLGSLLALLPMILTIGSLYLGAQEAIYEHVILYRADIGFLFGISPLTQILGLRSLHSSILMIAALLIAAWTALSLRGSGFTTASIDKRDRRLMLFSCLLPLVILLLGTGFGTQYLLWIWVSLPLVYAWSGESAIDRKLRLSILVLALSAAVIYPVLYLTLPQLYRGSATTTGDVSLGEWQQALYVEGSLLFLIFSALAFLLFRILGAVRAFNSPR